MSSAQYRENRTINDNPSPDVAKVDLRVRKTRLALVSAFRRLLEKYRYEDISISALCNEAMVRRSTFYKHFDDKEAFLRFFLDEMRRDFERHAELRPDEPLEEYLPRMNAELLAFLDENDALVRSFLQGSQAGLVVQSVSRTIAQNIDRRLKAAGEQDDVRASVRAGFLAGGIVNVVQREWLGSSDDPARRERVAAALFALERSVVGA